MVLVASRSMASSGDVLTATAAETTVVKDVVTLMPRPPATPPRPVAPAGLSAAPSSPAGSQGSAGDVSCAICLEHAQQEELAMVKGCDHSYCVNCILRWAAHREHPTCPQCKQPFEHLFTYRRLDGGLHDFPQEESVTLLKRACWFTNYMLVAESGRRLLSADDSGFDWRDHTPSYADPDAYDDDEAVEDYYMSSAAGRARVVFGNRRWGNSGYVAAGRQVARPSTQSRGKGKKGRCSDAGTSAGGSAAFSRASGSSAQKGAAGASPASAASPAADAHSFREATPSPAAVPSGGRKPARTGSWAQGPPSGLSSAFAAAKSSPPAAAAAVVVHSDAASGSSDSAGSMVPAARVPVAAIAGAKPIPMRRQGGPRGWEAAAAGSSPPASAGAAAGPPAGTSPGAMMGSSSSAYGSSPGGYMEQGLAPGRRARRAMRRAAEDGMLAGTTPPGGCVRPRRTAPVPDDWETAA